MSCVVVDIVGNRYARLVVLKRVPSRRKSKWRCRCDCGRLIDVDQDKLKSKHTKSCGCLNREKSSARIVKIAFKHGHARDGMSTPTYRSWLAMRWRCRDISRKYYGARGIKVCKRWMKFEHFLFDMGERPAGKSLDRYPNRNGNYQLSNCRWATQKEQIENRARPDPKSYPRRRSR